jgi:ribosomal protein S18 acetylase RimI-like enzyme
MKITQLTKDLALKHQEEILNLWDLIPGRKHSLQEITADTTNSGREMIGKWDHSLIAFDENQVVGFLFAQERKAENNDYYPHNCFYLKSMAVDQNQQGKGVGSKLIKNFLENCHKGYKYLSGPVIIKTQTNSANWNQAVINFYQKNGFEVVGSKEYADKKDVVLRCKLNN